MAAKSHSFSTKSEEDNEFVEQLKIRERQRGRANFSWVVITALRDYDLKIAEEEKLLEQMRHGK